MTPTQSTEQRAAGAPDPYGSRIWGVNARLTPVAIHCALLVLLAVILVVEYAVFFRSNAFGPEFTEFFVWLHGKPLLAVKGTYLQFNGGWYRPTQFFLPYLLVDGYVDWRNPAQWRALELATVFGVCTLIYCFTLQLLPGRRRAAFAAAAYFTCVPTIFLPIFEIAGFDFLHIGFVIIAAMAYIHAFRTRGVRLLLWTAFAWLAFIGALTSKEVTLATPGFLTVASAILLFYEVPAPERTRRAVREAVRLVPFFAMVPIYWFVHVRQIPADFANSGDYRKTTDWHRILENVDKYPLWLARVYKTTFDSLYQASGVDTWRNDVVGFALLAAVVIVSRWLWKRSPEYRPFLLLSMGWIAIFLVIPIYTGGYVWHANLALVGYCLLVGVAVDAVIALFPRRLVRAACAAGLLVVMIGLTRIDAYQWMMNSSHANTYRILSRVLNEPPVPLNRVSGSALVYVEDRDHVGDWTYGAGTLFNLVYEDQILEQVVVPSMSAVPQDARRRWIQHPNAFYFTYDKDYRWHDATAEFRTFIEGAEAAMPPKITKLGPSETKAGVGFNVQRDGSSAISVEGEGFTHHSAIIFGTKKLPTVFGSPKWITATVPNQFFARRGTIDVRVSNPGGVTSDAVPFRIK